MIRIHLRRLRPLAGLGLLVAASALSGCFNPFSPRIAPVLGTSVPPPQPNSAIGVLKLFEWCYNNKAIAEYREIFTDDYRFYFSPIDSAGAEYRGTPFTREDELISTTQLFVGGSATEPPASSIRLVLDRNFYVSADPYYPWDPDFIWHAYVRTRVLLTIQTSDGGAIDISGAAGFYLVRGDSAQIPRELRDRGFGPDPNRWYIRRWDDETAQPGGTAAFAARRADPVGLRPDRSRASVEAAAGDIPSWGAIKAYYLKVAVAPLSASARR